MLIEKPYEICTRFTFPNSKGETKCVILSCRDSNNHDFIPSVFENVLDRVVNGCENPIDFTEFVKFVDEHINEIKEDSRALGEKFESIVNRYKKILNLSTEVPENIIGWSQYDFLESGFDIRFEMKGKTRCLCYILSDTAGKENYWNPAGSNGVQVLGFRCEPVEERPKDDQESSDVIHGTCGEMEHAGTWGDDDGTLGWDD